MTPDFDRSVSRLLESGHCDAWDLPLPSTIAAALGLRYEIAHGLEAHGILADGGIQVSASLATRERIFAGAHELGHHVALSEGWGLEGRELEAACDRFAAALLMPRQPFLAALARFGDDWPEVAACFDVSETAAFLRAGEVTSRSVAVVAERVRARGELERHTEAELRGLARTPAPGIRRARLRDDPRRWALELSAS